MGGGGLGRHTPPMLTQKTLTFTVDGYTIEIDAASLLEAVREINAERKEHLAVRSLRTLLSATVTTLFVVESVRPTTNPAAMWRWIVTLRRTLDGKTLELQSKGETAAEAERAALEVAHHVKQSSWS